MSGLSFASATKTSLSTQPRSHTQTADLPFDAKLDFNRAVSKKTDRGDRNSDRNDSAIYSINPNQMLRTLDKDDLNRLVKITMAARTCRNGVSLWDTLFNVVNREALTACIFLANPDYAPISQGRVIVSTPYLNYTMPVSRVHLNRVEQNDKIGIGIYDAHKRKSYVLLYEVSSFCMVSEQIDTLEGRPSMIPGVNCSLTQVWRIEADGDAEILEVEEDQELTPNAKSFVEYIHNCVNNITEAFPWKPHFLPHAVEAFDRPVLEDRLSSDLVNAQDVSYGVFEDACRQLYKNAKEVKNTRNPKKVDKVRPKHPPLPVVEIVSLNNGDFVANLDGGDYESQAIKFNLEDLGDSALLERFLTNQDLTDRNLAEVPNIMPLSEDKFGPNAVLRYLTVNF